MHINETIQQAHNTAKEKGFWDKPEWNLGEKLMLITSELGEALEADRKGKYAKKDAFEVYLNRIAPQFSAPASLDESKLKTYIEAFQSNIKDSFEDEMADAVIRIFDLAGKMNINLEYHIKHKMAYNATRDKLHGKKY